MPFATVRSDVAAFESPASAAFFAAVWTHGTRSPTRRPYARSPSTRLTRRKRSAALSPPDKHQFVESVERGRSDWLESACRQGIRHVLVVSGHYDGGNELRINSRPRFRRSTNEGARFVQRYMSRIVLAAEGRSICSAARRTRTPTRSRPPRSGQASFAPGTRGPTPNG